MATDTIKTESGQSSQTTDASSQQQASSLDGQTAADMVSRAELDKTIGERQAAKERARKAEELLAERDARLKAMPDPTSLESYRKWEQEQAETARKKALKEGDADTIAAQARAPLVEENTTLKNRLASREAQLTASLRDDALRKAAIEAGAVNPDQVVMLLRPQVTMTETATGHFAAKFLDANGQPLYDVDGQVTDVSKFVKSFLTQPMNANLVKPAGNTGSGARPSGAPSGASNNIPTTLEEFNALSSEQREAVVSKMTKAQRHATLGISPTGGQSGYL